eukprot:4553336-Alexandrium_andersonii.AAC.1
MGTQYHGSGASWANKKRGALVRQQAVRPLGRLRCARDQERRPEPACWRERGDQGPMPPLTVGAAAQRLAVGSCILCWVASGVCVPQ